MNKEAPRPEWVDCSEAVETVFKVLFIILAAAFLLLFLFDYYLSDAIDMSLQRAEERNKALLAERERIQKRIEYLKGRVDTLDPVFDWWFSLMYGRMATKREKAFRNMDYILRYVGI